MIFIRLTYESFRFAWQALRSNLLRTTLSLLGVTIGIFAIIAVFTIVDSLERGVKKGMSFLGEKTIYVSKWPFIFTPSTPWWKYFNRPPVNYNEYRYLTRYVSNTDALAIIDDQGNQTFKNGSNSIQGVTVWGTSENYDRVVEIPFADGRYFSPLEQEAGREVAIIGYTIAEALFPGLNPVGKTFKVKGLKFTVVGTLARQGTGVLGGPDFDNTCFVPYKTFEKLFHTRWSEPNVVAKGLESDPNMDQLEAELTGLMRSRRGLRPIEEDNFSINRSEMIMQAVEGVFSVLTIAGWVIGSFSILVGGFGIANIMFVSVKERTNIIGIQKALGAKNYFILFQFLFEAVFLSVLGGAAGLLIVYLITFIPFGDLEVVLSTKNIILGLSVSSVIGILSGIIPARSAARLDPVIAIRSK
jgi:putative ABC transport system permease protein